MERNEKSLGRLSRSQLERFVAVAKSFDTWKNFYTEIERQPRFRRLIGSSRVQFQWAHLYELQLLELIALLIFTLDEDGSLQKGLSAAEDKQEFVIALGEESSTPVHEIPVRVRASKILLAVALLQVLIKSIESIQYFSLTMDELVRKVASGSDEAMIRAVSIDPTVLSCPPVAHRFSLAVIANDKKVLRRISKAFGGPHKAKMPNRDLRYLQRVLDDAGAFEVASRSQIFEVVADRLGLYEQLKGDPKKGLETLFARWKADAST